MDDKYGVAPDEGTFFRSTRRAVRAAMAQGKDLVPTVGGWLVKDRHRRSHPMPTRFGDVVVHQRRGQWTVWLVTRDGQQAPDAPEATLTTAVGLDVVEAFLDDLVGDADAQVFWRQEDGRWHQRPYVPPDQGQG